jgi:hypothetical protein
VEITVLTNSGSQRPFVWLTYQSCCIEPVIIPMTDSGDNISNEQTRLAYISTIETQLLQLLPASHSAWHDVLVHERSLSLCLSFYSKTPVLMPMTGSMTLIYQVSCTRTTDSEWSATTPLPKNIGRGIHNLPTKSVHLNDNLVFAEFLQSGSQWIVPYIVSVAVNLWWNRTHNFSVESRLVSIVEM